MYSCSLSGEVSALSLFDLVSTVLERRQEACEDEVPDGRFVEAVQQVLAMKVFTPREVQHLEEALKRRPRRRAAAPAGAAKGQRVPSALAELEKRLQSMAVKLDASGMLPGEVQVLREAGLVEEEGALGVAVRSSGPFVRRYLGSKRVYSKWDWDLLSKVGYIGIDTHVYILTYIIVFGLSIGPLWLIAPVALQRATMAEVSPADLKSLPNLPGYTFPERLGSKALKSSEDGHWDAISVPSVPFHHQIMI